MKAQSSSASLDAMKDLDNNFSETHGSTDELLSEYLRKKMSHQVHPQTPIYYTIWMESLQSRYNRSLSFADSCAFRSEIYSNGAGDFIGQTISILIDEATLTYHTGRIHDRRMDSVLPDRVEYLVKFNSGGDGRDSTITYWLCLEEFPCYICSDIVWIRSVPQYTTWTPALRCLQTGLHAAFRESQRTKGNASSSSYSSSSKLLASPYLYFVFLDEVLIEIPAGEEYKLVTPFESRIKEARPVMGKRLSVACAFVYAEQEERRRVRDKLTQGPAAESNKNRHDGGKNNDNFTSRDLQALVEYSREIHETNVAHQKLTQANNRKGRNTVMMDVGGAVLAVPPTLRQIACTSEYFALCHGDQDDSAFDTDEVKGTDIKPDHMDVSSDCGEKDTAPCVSEDDAQDSMECLNTDESTQTALTTSAAADINGGGGCDCPVVTGGGKDITCTTNVNTFNSNVGADASVSNVLEWIVTRVCSITAPTPTALQTNIATAEAVVEIESVESPSAMNVDDESAKDSSDALFGEIVGLSTDDIAADAATCADKVQKCQTPPVLASPSVAVVANYVYVADVGDPAGDNEGNENNVPDHQTLSAPRPQVQRKLISFNASISDKYEAFVAQQQALIEAQKEEERRQRSEAKRRKQEALQEGARKAREARLLKQQHEQEQDNDSDYDDSSNHNNTHKNVRNDRDDDDESLFLVGEITRRSLRRFLRHAGGSVHPDVINSLLHGEEEPEYGQHYAPRPTPRQLSVSKQKQEQYQQKLHEDVQALVSAQSNAPILLSDVERIKWPGTIVSYVTTGDIGRVVYFQSGWCVVRTLQGIVRARPYQLEVLKEDSVECVNFEDAEILLIDSEEDGVVDVEVEAGKNSGVMVSSSRSVAFRHSTDNVVSQAVGTNGDVVGGDDDFVLLHCFDENENDDNGEHHGDQSVAINTVAHVDGTDIDVMQNGHDNNDVNDGEEGDEGQYAACDLLFRELMYGGGNDDEEDETDNPFGGEVGGDLTFDYNVFGDQHDNNDNNAEPHPHLNEAVETRKDDNGNVDITVTTNVDASIESKNNQIERIPSTDSTPAQPTAGSVPTNTNGTNGTNGTTDGMKRRAVENNKPTRIKYLEMLPPSVLKSIQKKRRGGGGTSQSQPTHIVPVKLPQKTLQQIGSLHSGMSAVNPVTVVPVAAHTCKPSAATPMSAPAVSAPSVHNSNNSSSSNLEFIAAMQNLNSAAAPQLFDTMLGKGAAKIQGPDTAAPLFGGSFAAPMVSTTAVKPAAPAVKTPVAPAAPCNTAPTVKMRIIVTDDGEEISVIDRTAEEEEDEDDEGGLGSDERNDPKRIEIAHNTAVNRTLGAAKTVAAGGKPTDPRLRKPAVVSASIVKMESQSVVKSIPPLSQPHHQHQQPIGLIKLGRSNAVADRYSTSTSDRPRNPLDPRHQGQSLPARTNGNFNSVQSAFGGDNAKPSFTSRPVFGFGSSVPAKKSVHVKPAGAPPSHHQSDSANTTTADNAMAVMDDDFNLVALKPTDGEPSNGLISPHPLPSAVHTHTSKRSLPSESTDKLTPNDSVVDALLYSAEHSASARNNGSEVNALLESAEQTATKGNNFGVDTSNVHVNSVNSGPKRRRWDTAVSSVADATQDSNQKRLSVKNREYYDARNNLGYEDIHPQANRRSRFDPVAPAPSQVGLTSNPFAANYECSQDAIYQHLHHGPQREELYHGSGDHAAPQQYLPQHHMQAAEQQHAQHSQRAKQAQHVPRKSRFDSSTSSAYNDITPAQQFHDNSFVPVPPHASHQQPRRSRFDRPVPPVSFATETSDSGRMSREPQHLSNRVPHTSLPQQRRSRFHNGELRAPPPQGPSHSQQQQQQQQSQHALYDTPYPQQWDMSGAQYHADCAIEEMDQNYSGEYCEYDNGGHMSNNEGYFVESVNHDGIDGLYHSGTVDDGSAHNGYDHIDHKYYHSVNGNGRTDDVHSQQQSTTSNQSHNKHNIDNHSTEHHSTGKSSQQSTFLTKEQRRQQKQLERQHEKEAEEARIAEESARLAAEMEEFQVIVVPLEREDEAYAAQVRELNAQAEEEKRKKREQAEAAVRERDRRAEERLERLRAQQEEGEEIEEEEYVSDDDNEDDDTNGNGDDGDGYKDQSGSFGHHKRHHADTQQQQSTSSERFLDSSLKRQKQNMFETSIVSVSTGFVDPNIDIRAGTSFQQSQPVVSPQLQLPPSRQGSRFR